MGDAAAAADDRLLVEAWWYRWHPRTQRAVELVSSPPGPGSGAPGGGGVLLRRRLRGAAARQLPAGPGQGRRGGLRRRLLRRGRRPVGAAAAAACDGPRRRRPTSSAGSTSGPAARAWRAAGGAVAEVRCGIRGRDEQLVAVYGEDATLVLGSRRVHREHATSCLPCTRRPGPHPLRSDGRRASPREEFAPVDPYRLMVEAVARCRPRAGRVAAQRSRTASTSPRHRRSPSCAPGRSRGRRSPVSQVREEVVDLGDGVALRRPRATTRRPGRRGRRRPAAGAVLVHGLASNARMWDACAVPGRSRRRLGRP